MANIYKASVTGLGNSSPTSQTYAMDEGFPTSFEEFTDELGNVFIKIPTMYRKVDSVVDGQITAFTISTGKIDDTYIPYSVFVKPNGEVMPYVLIGKYCTNSSTSMNSITSSFQLNITIGNARTYAQALGTGYQQYDWQFQKLFVDLALLVTQKVNSQDGSATINSYLGVYDMSAYIWIDGVSRDSPTWCIAYDPTKYVDSATSSTDGYVAASYTAPRTSNAEVQKLGYDESNPFFNYPNETVSNTNYNTYYCDDYYYGSNVIRPVYSSAGDAYANYGLWHCSTGYGWSRTRGARLCYRPLNETVQETPTILIKNPLTLFTPATKVIGSDLIVNASEVEVVEAEVDTTPMFTIQMNGSGQSSYNYKYEEGMTWSDFVTYVDENNIKDENGISIDWRISGSDVLFNSYEVRIATGSSATKVKSTDLISQTTYYYYVPSGGSN